LDCFLTTICGKLTFAAEFSAAEDLAYLLFDYNKLFKR